MTHDAPRAIMDRLDALLEEERQAVLAGALDDIAGLAEEKERLIGALNAAAPDRQKALRGLHDKVARNQTLLDATLAGLRKVTARLAAVREVRRSLETYDENGRKSTIDGTATHRVEKRA